MNDPQTARRARFDECRHAPEVQPMPVIPPSSSRHTLKHSTLLKVGIAGTVMAALCCFTPVLVILLGALGLSAWLGWLDDVLLPALLVFAGITVYALRRQRQEDMK